VPGKRFQGMPTVLGAYKGDRAPFD
jgi:hypothetical protein